MAKITIDDTLHDNARHIALRAGYSSVDEFVTHLLETAAAEISETDSDEDVLERLRGLGYIS